jgi:hypothetical protein
LGIITDTTYNNGSADSNTPVNAGDYTVTVDIAEGDNFSAIDGLILDGTLTIAPSPQEINFAPADSLLVESGFYLLTATVSASGGAPALSPLFRSNNEAIAEVSGDTLWLKQSGTVTITAYIAHNSNYEDATEASHDIALSSSSTKVANFEVAGTTATNDDASYFIVDDPTTKTVTISVTPQDNSARVFYKDGEVTAPFDIPVEVSRGGRHEVSYTVVSQDGSQEQAYTITVEKRLNFDTYVIVKMNCIMVYNNRLLIEHGYTVNAFRWYGNGELLDTGAFYALSTGQMAFPPNVVYHFEMDTPEGTVRSIDKKFDVSTGVAEVEGSNRLLLYPNPLPPGATLNIHTGTWGAGERELLIYSAAGNLVLRQRFDGTFITLPFNAPAGVYFLRVGSRYGKMLVE